MGKRNVRYIFFLIFIFSLLSSGCGRQEEPEAKAQLVKTQQIGRVSGGDAVVYAGEVRGRYESQLAFQVSGKIVARHVDLGSRVRSGDVLLEIDDKDIAQSVNIGTAQVESARAQLSLAEANLNRFRKLYEEAAVSAAQYEQYRTNYDAALAAYQQAQAQNAQSSNALSYTKLTADSDGVIAAITAEAGQVVAAGQSVATLVKAGELEVEINVPENRVGDFRVGKDVAVEFWALNKTAIQGIVREVSPVADKVARTYKVRVSLPGVPDAVQLGMTAEVRCGVGDAAQEIIIPLSAVYQTGDSPHVWVVEEGIVRLAQVNIEGFDDNQVKITAGLNDGDVVVTAGVHKLAEGQQVRVKSGDEP